MRRPTLFFVFVTAGVGLGLFHLKYEVVTLEQNHRRVRKTIEETKEAIHVLKAEWSHLNDPKRLQELCDRYLTVTPIRGSQFVSLRQSPSLPTDLGEGLPENPSYDRRALDQLVAQLAPDIQLDTLND